MCNPSVEDFTFEVNNETITASIDFCENNFKQPTVLSLHGAGPHNRNRISYLTKFLVGLGLNTLRFDFSGHPDSTGELANSSLEKRVEEAKEASTFLDKSANAYTIIGTSMGGHIALELLSEIPINNIILFCPAAYTSEAYTLPFGKGFTNVIRRPNSYLNATVFKKLENFSGNFILFIGEEDQIIPKEVIEMYDHFASNTKRKKIIRIPNAPHSIHVWLEKNPEYLDLVFSEIKTVLYG